MKRIFLPILVSLCLASLSHGQKTATTPTFDNFDRAQGVPLYLPPPPMKVMTVKGKNGRKMQVVVEDKLVKKTGQTAAVTDALALREPVVNIGGVPKVT